jgi:hypothetical protein
MRRRLLLGGGINWTWYMECIEHNDGSITLKREYRLHNWRDDSHPQCDGTYVLILNGQQIEAIRINDERRMVIGAPVPRWNFDLKQELET